MFTFSIFMLHMLQLNQQQNLSFFVCLSGLMFINVYYQLSIINYIINWCFSTDVLLIILLAC